jgi:hypothetical protein
MRGLSKGLSGLAAIFAIQSAQAAMTAVRRSGNSLQVRQTTDATQELKPKLYYNFPNPSIIKDDDSGFLYAFSATSNGANVRAARSEDQGKVWNILEEDVLPKVGAWANPTEPYILSPHILKVVGHELVRHT